MPQYATHRGQQLDQKVNEACGRPDALGERGIPQYATQGSQQKKKKVNETYGRSDDPRKRENAPVCDSEQTGVHNVSKLLCSEICSSVM